MKRGMTCALCGVGMIVLILDSPTALSGAAEGVALCLRTLIPGLFPFFILSGLLTASLPRGGLALAGILGGYPVGAGNAAQCWRTGQLSREDAERAAVLFNCPGPGFIFGVAGQLFPTGRTVMLWAVYLSSTVILWMLLPKSRCCPAVGRPITLADAMHNALGAMATVCGWVVLMRTVLAVLDRWVLWILPDWARAVVSGILELTNGMLMLGAVEENLRFVLAAGMLGFGGVCVTMQTMGVAKGLSMKRYFPGKIFQGCVCLILSSVLTKAQIGQHVLLAAAALGLCCGLKLRKIENSYGNLRPVGV